MSTTWVPLSPQEHAERVKVAVAAGMTGAVFAVLLGRQHTRLDNMLIGGTFTAFVAYRDPRATVGGTLLVAAIKGAIWGGADQLMPKVMDYFVPPPKLQKGLVPESVAVEPAVAGYGYGY